MTRNGQHHEGRTLPRTVLKETAAQRNAQRPMSLKQRVKQTRKNEKKLLAPRMCAEAKVNIKVVTSRGKTYSQNWVYVPASVVHHPSFPFQPDEQVLVVIDAKGQRLVITKLLHPPLDLVPNLEKEMAA